MNYLNNGIFITELIFEQLVLQIFVWHTYTHTHDKVRIYMHNVENYFLQQRIIFVQIFNHGLQFSSQNFIEILKSTQKASENKESSKYGSLHSSVFL